MIDFDKKILSDKQVRKLKNSKNKGFVEQILKDLEEKKQLEILKDD